MDTNSIIGVYALTLNACSLFTNVNPTAIGIMSVHGHRIDNDETTIIALMTTDTDPTMALIDIAMTDIEQTMITTGTMTTGMTGTNHIIPKMISVTLIEVREIIDGTTTIIAENLLNPNREGPFHTMSRGTTRPRTALHLAYTRAHEPLTPSPTKRPRDNGHLFQM